MNRNVSFALALLAGAAVTACGEREPASANEVVANAPASNDSQPADTGDGWQLLASGEGTALRLVADGGAPTIHLFCPNGSDRLLVNLPSLKPIGSEERLSFGSGGTVVALVADSGGDALRGGVTGEGPVPSELGAILAGPISASYGAQTVGPLSTVGDADRAAFLSACGEKVAAPTPPVTVPPATAAACQMQDGKKLAAMRLRAIGTEPFWGAQIDGRCVTYSTPEDQAGTRIWTKFTGTAEAGTWSGALDGRQFELRTRNAPGCSDGMSDNLYPIAVTLRVRGETRTGCAKPA